MKLAASSIRSALACGAAAIAFGGARTPAIAKSATSHVATSPGGEFRASIAPTGLDPSGFTRYALTWTGPDGGGHASFSSDVASIQRLIVLDDGRAVLVGRTRVPRVSAFHEIALARANTIVVSECYAPVASPDGHYLAYVRIHPQRRAAAGEASVARMSAEYRVVDLTATTPSTTASYPIALQEPSNPGHTHELAQPFTWDDASRFHFADRFVGVTNRIYVTMDAAGKPSIASIVDVASGSPS